MCYIVWLVKRKHFEAKSDFSSQENMFGVVFKLGKAAAHTQCTESLGQSPGSFTLCLGEAWGEQGKGDFLGKTALGLVFVN